MVRRAVDTPGVDLAASGWPVLLQQIMSDYVALTMDEATLSAAAARWNGVCPGALRAFVRANRLDQVIRRFTVAPSKPQSA